MKKFIFLLLILLGPILLSSVVSINALDIGPGCQIPRYIPSSCQTPYQPGKSGGYTADLNCTAAKFIDPSNNCCPNRCVDTQGNAVGTSEDLPGEYRQFEVFGTSIRINPNNIGTLINLAFTTFLGLVSLYTIVRGIYVAGVKRPNSTNDEDIANISKELINLIIGFVICWSFIIVIQLLANFLGIGKLSDLDFTSGSGNLVITVK